MTIQRMKIGHIELFCENVVETAEFYIESLGFTEVHRDTDLIWVELAGFEILLRKGKNHTFKSYQNTNTAIVLYTKDLIGTREKLEERGVHFLGTDGSDDCLTFKDPSEHWIQLVNPEILS